MRNGAHSVTNNNHKAWHLGFVCINPIGHLTDVSYVIGSDTTAHVRGCLVGLMEYKSMKHSFTHVTKPLHPEVGLEGYTTHFGSHTHPFMLQFWSW